MQLMQWEGVVKNWAEGLMANAGDFFFFGG